MSDQSGRDRSRRPRPGGQGGSAGPGAGAGGAGRGAHSARPPRGDKPGWAPRDAQGKHAARDDRGRAPRPESTGRPTDGSGSRGSSRDLPEREGPDLRSVRPRHDDPGIPDEIKPNSLESSARIQLKTLSKENADEVARHLAMAARLIEDDPDLAHRHALSAARRAGRIAVVRETLAITAYATGDFALALRELRTYRRISGSNDQLPLMVDSERGVGRPDRALETGRSVDRATLPVPVQVSLAIAMSGARLDLGQAEAALAELEIPQLDPRRAFEYSPALFSAYAEVLDELGRSYEAAVWRERADIAEDALSDEYADDVLEVVDLAIEDDSIEDSANDEVPVSDPADADVAAGDDVGGDVRPTP